MAGGPNAAVATCLECGGPADRTYEGLEDDHYTCRACGTGFQICFDPMAGGSGPPPEPLYPPPPGVAQAIRNRRAPPA